MYRKSRISHGKSGFLAFKYLVENILIACPLSPVRDDITEHSLFFRYTAIKIKFKEALNMRLKDKVAIITGVVLSVDGMARA